MDKFTRMRLVAEAKARNHYIWLDKNWEVICKEFKIPYEPGVISAHGDKAYEYMKRYEKDMHPFHTVALYLISYYQPYSDTIRETENGWVSVETWLDNNKYLAAKLPIVVR